MPWLLKESEWFSLKHLDELTAIRYEDLLEKSKSVCHLKDAYNGLSPAEHRVLDAKEHTKELRCVQ